MSTFFIDECLTTQLVAIAKSRGLMAAFGPHIGIAGWQDWSIAKFCVEEDCIVVTNNRRDFLNVFAKLEIHPGLIILIPKENRQLQCQWFSKVLDMLGKQNDDLVNKLMEVDRDGNITIEEWSSSLYDAGKLK